MTMMINFEIVAFNWMDARKIPPAFMSWTNAIIQTNEHVQLHPSSCPLSRQYRVVIDT